MSEPGKWKLARRGGETVERSFVTRTDSIRREDILSESGGETFDPGSTDSLSGCEAPGAGQPPRLRSGADAVAIFRIPDPTEEQTATD